MRKDSLAGHSLYLYFLVCVFAFVVIFRKPPGLDLVVKIWGRTPPINHLLLMRPLHLLWNSETAKNLVTCHLESQLMSILPDREKQVCVQLSDARWQRARWRQMAMVGWAEAEMALILNTHMNTQIHPKTYTNTHTQVCGRCRWRWRCLGRVDGAH